MRNTNFLALAAAVILGCIWWTNSIPTQKRPLPAVCTSTHLRLWECTNLYSSDPFTVQPTVIPKRVDHH
jgi:hypothetical protein